MLILSSPKTMAGGFDNVAPKIVAIEDVIIPMFELLSGTSGFPSKEHLTLPTLAIDGNPIEFFLE